MLLLSFFFKSHKYPGGKRTPCLRGAKQKLNVKYQRKKHIVSIDHVF